MKPGQAFKSFACFVCLFSLIFMGEFSSLYAESKGRTLPMGEMISWGNVKLQVSENVWKNVEPASFPVFPGMTIKTEKGAAAISFGEPNQIEVGPNSILVLERKDQIRLLKGSLDFRVAPHKGLNFCAGNFIVVGTLPLQAGRSSASLSGSQETLGSLTIHPNGAVTIRGNQGHLTLLNQERAVLAAISSKESFTVPAAIAEKNSKGKKSPVQFAQVGEEEEGPAAAQEKKAGPAKAETSSGLSGTTWMAIGIGVLVVGGIGAMAGGGGGGGGGGGSPPPACP
jgi:hypothetical protein